MISWWIEYFHYEITPKIHFECVKKKWNFMKCILVSNLNYIKGLKLRLCLFDEELELFPFQWPSWNLPVLPLEFLGTFSCFKRKSTRFYSGTLKEIFMQCLRRIVRLGNQSNFIHKQKMSAARVLLPGTDLNVSRLCLGCWQFNANKANPSWDAQPEEVGF